MQRSHDVLDTCSLPLGMSWLIPGIIDIIWDNLMINTNEWMNDSRVKRRDVSIEKLWLCQWHLRSHAHYGLELVLHHSQTKVSGHHLLHILWKEAKHEDSYHRIITHKRSCNDDENYTNSYSCFPPCLDHQACPQDLADHLCRVAFPRMISHWKAQILGCVHRYRQTQSDYWWQPHYNIINTHIHTHT